MKRLALLALLLTPALAVSGGGFGGSRPAPSYRPSPSPSYRPTPSYRPSPAPTPRVYSRPTPPPTYRRPAPSPTYHPSPAPAVVITHTPVYIPIPATAQGPALTLAQATDAPAADPWWSWASFLIGLLAGALALFLILSVATRA